jgi:hypothetical protein
MELKLIIKIIQKQCRNWQDTFIITKKEIIFAMVYIRKIHQSINHPRTGDEKEGLIERGSRCLCRQLITT